MTQSYTTPKDKRTTEKEIIDSFYIPPPEYTQMPNIFVDGIMSKLTGAETKIALVIMRETFGWQRNWKDITISQIMKATGLTKKHVINATTSLLKKGLIEKKQKGPKNHLESYYRLVVGDKKSLSKKVSGCKKDTPQGCKKDTPPYIYNGIKERKEKERATAPATPPPLTISKSKKVKFGEHVLMTQDEYDKLCEDKTKTRTDLYIEKLNDYAEVKEKRFKEYTNHAKVIRQWMKRDDESYIKKSSEASSNARKEENMKMVSRLSKQSQQLQGIFKIYSEYVEIGESTGAYSAPCIRYDDKDFRRKIEEWLYKHDIKFLL